MLDLALVEELKSLALRVVKGELVTLHELFDELGGQTHAPLPDGLALDQTRVCGDLAPVPDPGTTSPGPDTMVLDPIGHALLHLILRNRCDGIESILGIELIESLHDLRQFPRPKPRVPAPVPRLPPIRAELEEGCDLEDDFGSHLTVLHLPFQ